MNYKNKSIYTTNKDNPETKQRFFATVTKALQNVNVVQKRKRTLKIKQKIFSAK